ncbi:hypothetical protein NRC85_003985 [Vibrio parahaemolyticus]|nr:hypothetical protein [Vibrio parahaemolyticus]
MASINTKSNQPKETTVSKAVQNTLDSTKGREGLFVIIPVTVSSPATHRTVKTLKQTTSSGEDVTSNRKVHNATVEMFDPKSISFTVRYRDQMKALLREEGFNLGNGLYLVSEAKVDKLYRKIISCMKKYNADVEDFLTNYPKLIQQQMLLNPKLREEIKKHHPSEAELRRSFRFRVGAPQAVQVHSCVSNVKEIFKEEGVSTNLATGMMEPIIESICTDLKHFWNYNLRNIRRAMEEPQYRESFSNVANKKSGMKGIFLTLLQNMRAKVQEAEALEPRLSKVTGEFNKLIDSIPDKNMITESGMYSNYDVSVRVNEFATRMSEPEYIQYLVNSEMDASKTEDDVKAVTEMAEQIRMEAEQTETREVTLTDLVCEAELQSKAAIEGKTEETQLMSETDNLASEVEEPNAVEQSAHESKPLASTTITVDDSTDAALSATEESHELSMAELFANVGVDSFVDSQENIPTEESDTYNIANGEELVTIETSPVDFDANSVTIDDYSSELTQPEQPQKRVEEEIIEPELQTTERLSQVVNLDDLFQGLC